MKFKSCFAQERYFTLFDGKLWDFFFAKDQRVFILKHNCTNERVVNFDVVVIVFQKSYSTSNVSCSYTKCHNNNRNLLIKEKKLYIES